MSHFKQSYFYAVGEYYDAQKYSGFSAERSRLKILIDIFNIHCCFHLLKMNSFNAKLLLFLFYLIFIEFPLQLANAQVHIIEVTLLS